MWSVQTKSVGMVSNFDDEDKSYYDPPWEIQAHGREMGPSQTVGHKSMAMRNKNGPNTKTIHKTQRRAKMTNIKNLNGKETSYDPLYNKNQKLDSSAKT